MALIIDSIKAVLMFVLSYIFLTVLFGLPVLLWWVMS